MAYIGVGRATSSAKHAFVRLDRVRGQRIVFAIVAAVVAIVGLRSIRKRSSPPPGGSGAFAIAAAREAIRQAALRGDACEYASQYAAGARVTTRGGNALVGRSAVESAMRETLSQVRFTKSTIDCTTLPTVANDIYEERGIFRFSVTRGAHSADYAGGFVATWRREGERWKIVTEVIDPVVT